MASLRAHLRTIRPFVGARLAPARPEPAEAFATELVDPDVGTVRLTGELRDIDGADALVLLIHGLGGSPASDYVRAATRDFGIRGYATLSLALRGADRAGEDFYNVGLAEDLQAALASPRLARFARVFVVGFSMGGYVGLHFAARSHDPRVGGVVALCTPLDLKAAQVHIDSRTGTLYRAHVLRGLREIYAAVAARRPVPTDPARVARVRTIHEWDRLTIAPRYGYDGPESYYAALAAGPLLARLECPTLLVTVRDDPVIPAAAVDPFLPPEGEAPLLRRVVAEDSGHLAFPRRVDLGLGAERGLIGQLAGWFATLSATAADAPREAPGVTRR